MKYSFKELVDLSKLQELTDEFSKVTSFFFSIVGMDGEIITCSGWQRVCTEFHRQHPQARKECIKSDTKFKKKMEAGNAFAIYNCPFGLVNASSPIIITGQHVANVIAGQVFLEPPDKTKEQFFREQAQKFEFDEAAYLKAFREIPVFTEEKFRSILSFLAKLAQIIARLGDFRLSELESENQLRESETKLKSLFEESVDEVLLYEVRLKESDARFKRLLNSIHDVVWTADLDGRMRYINPAAERIYGTARSEFYKNPEFWIEMIHPEDREEAVKQSESLFDTGKVESQYRIIRNDGQVRWIKDRKSVVYNDAGDPVHIGGIATDITKEILTEKILRIERDKVQGVLNVMGDSVYIANKDYVIEFQNTAFREEFSGLAGKKCYESIFKQKEPCDFCLRQESLKEGRIRQLEAIFLNQKWYDISFSPFEEAGGAIKSVVVLRDITEKKYLQAEALRAAHLASLGELAAGVAHEINNPVTGIISIAEILVDKFHELGGDKKIPERIVHEGDRIANIVKNLLSFARDKKEEHSPVHIYDILKLTLELVEKQIFKDGIHLSVNIPSDMPKINAQSQEIQQVFLNIISNARYALKKKYPGHHENKILEINGELIFLEKKKYMRLIFYDRGLGIPKKFVDKVADPFFSTKPQGEGTGLGLSISHGIIETHGGKLWFESKEGEYTKVMVDLPMHNGRQSRGEI